MEQPALQVIDQALLDRLSQEASQSQRRRRNH